MPSPSGNEQNQLILDRAQIAASRIIATLAACATKLTFKGVPLSAGLTKKLLTGFTDLPELLYSDNSEQFSEEQSFKEEPLLILFAQEFPNVFPRHEDDQGENGSSGSVNFESDDSGGGKQASAATSGYSNAEVADAFLSRDDVALAFDQMIKRGLSHAFSNFFTLLTGDKNDERIEAESALWYTLIQGYMRYQKVLEANNTFLQAFLPFLGLYYQSGPLTSENFHAFLIGEEVVELKNKMYSGWGRLRIADPRDASDGFYLIEQFKIEFAQVSSSFQADALFECLYALPDSVLLENYKQLMQAFLQAYYRSDQAGVGVAINGLARVYVIKDADSKEPADAVLIIQSFEQLLRKYPGNALFKELLAYSQGWAENPEFLELAKQVINAHDAMYPVTQPEAKAFEGVEGGSAAQQDDDEEEKAEEKRPAVSKGAEDRAAEQQDEEAAKPGSPDAFLQRGEPTLRQQLEKHLAEQRRFYPKSEGDRILLFDGCQAMIVELLSPHTRVGQLEKVKTNSDSYRALTALYVKISEFARSPQAASPQFIEALSELLRLYIQRSKKDRFLQQEQVPDLMSTLGELLNPTSVLRKSFVSNLDYEAKFEKSEAVYQARLVELKASVEGKRQEAVKSAESVRNKLLGLEPRCTDLLSQLIAVTTYLRLETPSVHLDPEAWLSLLIGFADWCERLSREIDSVNGSFQPIFDAFKEPLFIRLHHIATKGQDISFDEIRHLEVLDYLAANGEARKLMELSDLEATPLTGEFVLEVIKRIGENPDLTVPLKQQQVLELLPWFLARMNDLSELAPLAVLARKDERAAPYRFLRQEEGSLRWFALEGNTLHWQNVIRLVEAQVNHIATVESITSLTPEQHTDLTSMMKTPLERGPNFFGANRAGMFNRVIPVSEEPVQADRPAGFAPDLLDAYNRPSGSSS